MSKKIYGILMRPCSTSLEDNKKTMHSSRHSVKKNFMMKYRDHMAAMQIIAECAKCYIMDNYQKITDWPLLDIIINDNSGTETTYYNYTQQNTNYKSPILSKLMKSIDTKNKKKHNPVVSLTECVLDPTDGDFSVTINGKQHLWLDDESVIEIADFIETTLKNKHKK